MRLTEEQREERARRLSESMKEKWRTNREDMIKAYRSAERYKNNPHKQLESPEAYAAYMREYQKTYRLSHGDYYKKMSKLNRLPKQIQGIQNKLDDENWVNSHTPLEVKRFLDKLDRYKHELEALLEERDTNASPDEKTA